MAVKAKKSISKKVAPAAGKRKVAKKKVVVPKGGSDLSAEEKIKEAARKLFTQKGFAATRTRDIAQEAGINLALLNYYFRSKEKLFEIIMAENFKQFIRGISVNLSDERATIVEKADRIVKAYIDFLTLHPDLPLFVLNEIRGNPSRFAKRIDEEVAPMRTLFLKQIREAGKDGRILPIDPFHFIANLIGLTVFPFVARPILQRVTGTTDEQFNAFMQERKTLVPDWIRAILGSKALPATK
ncbi:MAG: TetR family transcriptional regulator [Puia sp.]|nr:TetR family transcriptional regulator [Puia sp.]